MPVDSNASQVATLTVKPTSVHQSPTSGQLVVIGKTQAGTGVVYVMNTGNAPPPTDSADRPALDSSDRVDVTHGVGRE